ncbi:MAG: hypothetical protein IJQ75_08305 [Synergistaceae bacterium]|nr:hypothetical protein [Synergistaceae bacterium]MBR0279962.1 hypothetical protein [Synergistaceae bacterium]
MMYPFMTLNDGTEITHSEMYQDGSVKVYIETPTDNGFKNAECWLPMNRWEINGYSWLEMQYLKHLVMKSKPLFMEFSQDGGVLCANDSVGW